MKRLILGLVMLVALMATASVATAQKVVVKDIGWWRTDSLTAQPTSVARRQISSGTAQDTTFVFSLRGVSLPKAALAGAANKDTVTVAYVRFFTDSSAAIANNLTSVTYRIEGSGDMLNWYTVQLNASNAIVSDSATSFIIPLWLNTGSPEDAGGKVSPLISAPYLRIRFTAVTGTPGMRAVRCQFVYLEDPNEKLTWRNLGWATSQSQTLGESAADTTAVFSLTGTKLPNSALASASGKDTVIVGYVGVHMEETSSGQSSTLSAASYVIESSGDNVNWYTVPGQTANVTANPISSTELAFNIPLWVNTGIGANSTGVETSPLLSAPYLRVRFIGFTGEMQKAKCRLIYFE